MQNLMSKRALLVGVALVVIVLSLLFSGNFKPAREPALDPVIDTSRSPFAIVDGYDRAFPGAVGAFDCGSNNYVGAIEPGRPYRLLEDRGDGWARVDIYNSGELCVRVSELIR